MNNEFDPWPMPDWQAFSFDTQAVRAGQKRGSEGEHAEPIYPTSSFAFHSAAEAAARFSGEQAGNIYSRFTNPTVAMFERRLATLEGGETCVAFSSGMAAIMATTLGLLNAGDHLLSSRAIFGTTSVFFENFLSRWGIESSFVDLTDLDAWERAIQPNTRLLYVETPSNPLGEIADIAALAALANRHQALLIVDNVYATPALQRPLEMGAHIVVHSATKYIDGQGRVLGGAVVGSEEVVGKQVYGFLRSTGPTLSPFNAWVLLKGLETLSLRIERHSASALRLAEWLDAQAQVRKVFYPGLKSHPQHALAASQASAFGGVLAFEISGGKEAAWALIDALRIPSITANLGDAKSTVTHPASTTHSRLSAEQRLAAGIDDALVRISVGLEDVDDLIADLQQALAVSGAG